MSKTRFIWIAVTAVAGVLTAAGHRPAVAQAAKQPERKLVGLSLGRPFLDVIRRFGQPSEIQTVALANSQESLPGLGSAGGMGAESGGMMGMPGMPMGMGMGMGMRGGGGAGNSMGGGAMPFGGGSPFGGGMMGGGGGAGNSMGGGGRMGLPGGIPSLPPAGMGMGGGGNSMGGGGMRMGMPGAEGSGPGMMGGMMGMSPGGGGSAAGAGNLPEYSNAILWIYKMGPGKDKDTRLEFLINEDGRLAQISIAAPADKAAGVAKMLPTSRTSKGVTLGTNLTRVMDSYGYPERHRLLPGLRFYEVYYSKNYHAAFTFDTLKNMKCVRITIALAD